MNKLKITTLMLSAALLLPIATTQVAYAGPSDAILGGSTVDKDDNSNELPIPPGETITKLQSKKVVIKEVSCDQDTIVPGKPFTLTLKVKNMTSSKLEKVAMMIDLSQKEDYKQSFIPVGTTNEIYVGTIDAKKEKTVSITLVSNPKIETGAYSFNANISFNTPGNSQEVISKIVGVMVDGVSNIEIRDTAIELAGGVPIIKGVIGNATESKISDVKVVATVDGEEYFSNISSIDADDEGDFDISLPASTTDRVATITAKYLDSRGNEILDTSELSIPGYKEDLAVVAPDSLKPEKLSLWDRIKSWFGLGE